MPSLQPVYTVSVSAVLSFPIEATSAEGALRTWRSWLARYRGRLPLPGGGAAIVDTATVAVLGRDDAADPLHVAQVDGQG
jgi:hypothetical protein